MHIRRYVLWVCVFGLIFLIEAGPLTNTFGSERNVLAHNSQSPQAPTDPNIFCVNATGSGCDAVCGACLDNLQLAVDWVPTGGTVRVALGTYIGGGDAVLDISRPMTVYGSYNHACSVPYTGPTVLTGENARTVIKVDGVGGTVNLHNLTLMGGIGDGNCDANAELKLGGCGGGLYVYETPITVNNVEFINNTGNTSSWGPWGGTGAGGGAFIANYLGGYVADFNACTFTANTGSSSSVGWGGGLWIDAGTLSQPAEINSTTFISNVASNQNQGYGGGANISGYVKMDGSTFLMNRGGTRYAQFGYGGALYVWSAELFEMTNNLIKMNKAVDIPYPLSGTASMGGAIFASTNVTMTAINNIIANNSARDAGTAIYLESTEPALPLRSWWWHNAIVGNRGASTAGVVTVGDRDGTTYANLENNIIAGNTFGLDIESPFGGDVLDPNFNCIWNDIEGFKGSFYVNEDPRLSPEYYPQETSPVIGAGTWPISSHPALLQDWDGLTRPQQSYPNMGVYESTRDATYFPVLFRK